MSIKPYQANQIVDYVTNKLFGSVKTELKKAKERKIKSHTKINKKLNLNLKLQNFNSKGMIQKKKNIKNAFMRVRFGSDIENEHIKDDQQSRVS